MSNLFVHPFEHKAWANAELFEILIAHDGENSPKGWKLATRLMNHLYVVDRIFIGHLSGVAHGYTATNTPETPLLTALRDQTAETDRWWLDFVDSLQAEQGLNIIEFTFTDGKAGRMSVNDMLFHVLTHGSYHRGMIGKILSEAKISAPRDILTGYLHRES
ncbi:DinB family protein [Chitinibacter sp. S2-10]|uniref:DinB family protein n=1 Tax=Chitinibacter sp. S2-10 TaxID=3373597 RepID=UPI0039772C22